MGSDSVSYYIGPGLTPRADGGDGGSEPLWDGNDRWKIVPEVLVPSASPSVDEPLYRDDQAYVSGGMLVAHFPRAFISPGVPGLPNLLIPVHQVVLAGLLIRVGEQWALQNAVLAMRQRYSDLPTAAAQYPDNQVPGEIVC
jgi:hypothetical protein